MEIGRHAVYDWVNKGMPANGELLSRASDGVPFVITADLDGDGLREIIFGYRLGDTDYIRVLRYERSTSCWTVMNDVSGQGASLSVLKAVPDTSRGGDALKIGWQQRDRDPNIQFVTYRRQNGALLKVEDDLDAAGRADAWQPGLFPAAVKAVGGTKWGYIDTAGHFRISPQFEQAEPFQANGLAVAGTAGLSGLINPSGQFVVKPVFDFIGSFSEHRAVVIDKEGFKVIDEQGRIITSQAYSYINEYKEGRAVFAAQSGSQYGYLDLQGQEVISPKFTEASDFQAGKALVKTSEGRYALIDKMGKVLHTYNYPVVGQPGDGLLAFKITEDGKFGYMDEAGNVKIQPQYTMALPFAEGRAIVNTAADYRNQYGVIDRQGKFVIDPVYNDIQDLGEGRFAVGIAIDKEKPYVGSIYAVTDKNGRRLTETIFYGVSGYRNGLASVYDAKQTYFIDLSGRQAAGPAVKGSGTLTPMNGLVQANVDMRVSYYTPAGQLVWSPNTVIPLSRPYQVIEHKYKPNKDYLVYYPEVSGMSDPLAQQRVNEKLKELSGVKPVGSGQLDASFSSDFTVSLFRKQLLQLEIIGYNYPFGAAHGMPSRVYAHIDLVTGRFYELKDLFKEGSDYVKVLSGIIGEQIKNDPQYSYVFPDSYKGIAPDQPFYVTEDALYIYFNPYDIAPYAAGFPTFRIPFKEIASIIAQEKPFWQSFH